MKFEPAITPYLRPTSGVAAMMREVILSLVPAIICYAFFFGPGIFINMLLCLLVCLASEALVVRLRGGNVASTLGDHSIALTAVLLAFALPPYTPWYVVVTACLSAVVLAKHAYGGLGYNLFNPAMVGYAVVLISFPIEMSTWLGPSLGDLDYSRPEFGQALHYILTGNWPAPLDLDAVSRATPLDLVRNGVRDAQLFAEMRNDPRFGDFGGYGWEWVGNFLALGGAWLLYRGIIRWHIPVAVLAGILIPASIDAIGSAGAHAGPGFHLFSGATLLGAFYIATDPVSAATSPRGRLIYGFGIGFIAWAIRTWGGYPDGIAFAVLLMNMCAPLIDRFTAPRIMGHD